MPVAATCQEAGLIHMSGLAPHILDKSGIVGLDPDQGMDLELEARSEPCEALARSVAVLLGVPEHQMAGEGHEPIQVCAEALKEFEEGRGLVIISLDFLHLPSVLCAEQIDAVGKVTVNKVELLSRVLWCPFQKRLDLDQIRGASCCDHLALVRDMASVSRLGFALRFVERFIIRRSL